MGHPQNGHTPFSISISFPHSLHIFGRIFNFIPQYTHTSALSLISLPHSGHFIKARTLPSLSSHILTF